MTTRSSRSGAVRAIAALALLALATAACTGGTDPSSTGAPATEPATAIPQEPSMNPESPAPEGVVPDAIVQAAKDDAAARAGVDPGSVTVVKTLAITFPNGALGCPEPGMMYTEVLTPGYQVVVEAGGKTYDYRASTRGGSLKWCESPPSAG